MCLVRPACGWYCRWTTVSCCHCSQQCARSQDHTAQYTASSNIDNSILNSRKYKMRQISESSCLLVFLLLAQPLAMTATLAATVGSFLGHVCSMGPDHTFSGDSTAASEHLGGHQWLLLPKAWRVRRYVN